MRCSFRFASALLSFRPLRRVVVSRMMDASTTCGRDRSMPPRSSSVPARERGSYEDRHRFFRHAFGRRRREARYDGAAARRDHRRAHLARVRGHLGGGVSGEGARRRIAAERVSAARAHARSVRHRRRGDPPGHGRRTLGCVRGRVRLEPAGAPPRPRARGEHADAVRAASRARVRRRAHGRGRARCRRHPRDAARHDRHRALVPHPRGLRLSAPRRSPS